MYRREETEEGRLDIWVAVLAEAWARVERAGGKNISLSETSEMTKSADSFFAEFCKKCNVLEVHTRYILEPLFFQWSLYWENPVVPYQYAFQSIGWDWERAEMEGVKCGVLDYREDTREVLERPRVPGNVPAPGGFRPPVTYYAGGGGAPGVGDFRESNTLLDRLLKKGGPSGTSTGRSGPGALGDSPRATSLRPETREKAGDLGANKPGNNGGGKMRNEPIKPGPDNGDDETLGESIRGGSGGDTRETGGNSTTRNPGDSLPGTGDGAFNRWAGYGPEEYKPEDLIGTVWRPTKPRQGKPAPLTWVLFSVKHNERTGKTTLEMRTKKGEKPVTRYFKPETVIDTWERQEETAADIFVDSLLDSIVDITAKTARVPRELIDPRLVVKGADVGTDRLEFEFVGPPPGHIDPEKEKSARRNLEKLGAIPAEYKALGAQHREIFIHQGNQSGKMERLIQGQAVNRLEVNKNRGKPTLITIKENLDQLDKFLMAKHKGLELEEALLETAGVIQDKPVDRIARRNGLNREPGETDDQLRARITAAIKENKK